MEFAAAQWQRVVPRFGIAGGDGTQGLEVSLEHSWPWAPWVTLLLVVGAALLVTWIYFDERARASRALRVALATFRLSLIMLLLCMMYGWAVNRHRTDLPDLVLVLDDSQSMGVADQFAGTQLRAELERRVERIGRADATRWNQGLALLLDPTGGWLQLLENRYRLKVYRLGETARLVGSDSSEPWDARLRALAPQESSSRLGEGLQQILEAQRGRPTAAVLLLSDGISTDGRSISDVAELARRRAIPLFMVGLGDDLPPRDLRLTDLLVDDTAFVDDVVNFDIKLQHNGFPDRQVTVELRDTDGKILADQTVTLVEFGGPQPVRLSYRPTQVGELEHIIEVTGLDEEANLANNRLERSVLVRDTQIRVLLVQAAPSYEFRTLKHLLSRAVRAETGRKVIELTTVLQEADFENADQDETAARVFPVSRDELFGFDVVIVGDADPSFFGSSVKRNMVDFVTTRGGGMVFVSGPRYTPLAYRGSVLEDLIPVDLSSAYAQDSNVDLEEPVAVMPTPLGLESPHFQVGSSRTDTDAIWRALPGVYWFTTARDLRPAARVLAETILKPPGDEEAIPVVSMQFVGAGKVVFHATDETYRWSQHLGDDRYYARYWLQLIRYLSRSKLLSDRELAEVLTDRHQYGQGDAVRVQIHFRDDRKAPISDDGVRVALEAETGQRRELVLHRNSVERGEFVGFVDDLDAGTYRIWLVSPSLEPRPSAARFSVEPPAGEHARLQLESRELEEAARLSRGKFYRIQNAGRLLNELPRGRQVRVESLPPQPIWNSSWLAALFVVLITAEWLLRKRVGMV